MCDCGAVTAQWRGGCLQNALLDGTRERPLLKICDFGYSKNEHLDSKPKSLSGTPDYIAPEVPTPRCCPPPPRFLPGGHPRAQRPWSAAGHQKHQAHQAAKPSGRGCTPRHLTLTTELVVHVWLRVALPNDTGLSS